MESKELIQIRAKLITLANPSKAAVVKNYMKSDYAFYGITVPQLRAIAKETAKNLSIYEAYNLFDELWNSGNHEEMSFAAFLLQNYKKDINLDMWKFLMHGERPRIEKAKSWDHIDDISSHLTGTIFLNNSSQLQHEIKNLSISRNPWMRRLAIISQYPSIKKGKIQLTILLAEKLVYDEDIYVQKGVGWMLREAGKKNPIQVQEFIKMNRGMKAFALSYALEKMPQFKVRIKSLLAEDKANGVKKPEVDNRSEMDKIKYFKN
jgi:3-methyladenine DNA glycosylase AlkD